MKSIELNYQYSREQMDKLFQCANIHDVDNGGVYDARSAAINIYTHKWNEESNKEESTCICTFYFDWVKLNVWKMEVEDWFTFDDGYARLGDLEQISFGRTIYGIAA